MAKKNIFSVSEFAKLSRTTRDTLHHYDKIGLLAPASRGDNKYRYYTNDQLTVLNMIQVSQELGMSLSDIKKGKDSRDPRTTKEFLEQAICNIDEKIGGWVRAKKLLFTLQKIINSVDGIDEDKITIETLPAEAIIMGDLNDYSMDRNDYDALFTFYQTMAERHGGLDLNYPVWAMFSQERIMRGDTHMPDRFYFYNPEGFDKRPAGQYAVGYTRGGYGMTGGLYERITNHIKAEGYEISGSAYEEYPLNEISVSDYSNFLIRVMITVQKIYRKDVKF